MGSSTLPSTTTPGLRTPSSHPDETSQTAAGFLVRAHSYSKTAGQRAFLALLAEPRQQPVIPLGGYHAVGVSAPPSYGSPSQYNARRGPTKEAHDGQN